MTEDPHADQPVQVHGTLKSAEKAVILLHGRGASANSILRLSQQLPQENVVYLAPQAANRTWYPNSFLAPVEQNEPGRTSGLNKISVLVQQIQDAGITTENVFIASFSQGACLATEYAARRIAPESAARTEISDGESGGILGFSGGLIGETINMEEFTGDMNGTPVFLGCSDADPHIPLERVNETAAVFNSLNADVEKRIYEGMGHTINEEEIAYFKNLLIK